MLQITNQTTMSSREIATLTGKEHKNVLTDIRKVLNDLELNTADFSAMYKAENGQEYELFNLPKRECLILVSGYSIALRAKIIDRWQELENQNNKPMSMTEIVAYNANQLLKLEQEQEQLKQRLLEVESKALATQENYYTMSGYCNLKGLKFDDKELASLGRQASKISKLRNVEIKKFHSAKFGTVNQYDVTILSEIV